MNRLGRNFGNDWLIFDGDMSGDGFDGNKDVWSDLSNCGRLVSVGERDV
jgi:hypothetical protein